MSITGTAVAKGGMRLTGNGFGHGFALVFQQASSGFLQ